MNYKEKYNKLVEAVKVLQEENPSDEGIQNWVKDNIPELAESEDERIRKEIIAILQYKYDNFSKDPKYCNAPQWIAWLEKQGQKPAEWDEVDEKMWKSALWHIKNSCGNGGKTSGEYEVYHWLKTLKERHTWKPSEKQIEALEDEVRNNKTVFRKKVLNELLEQLKKL